LHILSDSGIILSMTTGIVYNDVFLQHDLPGHPENAGRLKAIMSYLETQSLLPGIERMTGRPAEEEELLLCHDQKLITLLKTPGRPGIHHIDMDTYMNEYSWEAAVTAAGGMIDLAGRIADKKLKNGIILARPPGHHATRHQAMGFCLLNTIALGAGSLLASKKIKNAAIVDIDVHHGNGTQDIFYNDPDLLYISTHQYPHYPGTGSMNQTGEGEGKGTTLNIPFPAFTGDRGYMIVLKEVIVPALQRFCPGFIFVSLGFDAHADDPLSSIQLSLTGYHEVCGGLIQTAEEVCGGRIIFCLEGGYNGNVLGPGTGNIVRALTGDNTYDDPLPRSGESLGPEPADKLMELIEEIKKIHNL
jgi:acetoin utilization deacetylase AcuC-like enzyme